jgi:hypothetical protein
MSQDGKSVTNNRSKLKRWLLAPLIYTAAILLLIEDWLWDATVQVLARLSALPAVKKLEQWIAGLHPYVALAAFVLPMALLLPVKIGALYFIACGHALVGTIVIIVAKVVGAALTARLYQLTRPRLLSLPWFARWHFAFINLKNRLIVRLRATTAWRRLKRIRSAIRRKWRLFRAALRQRFSNGKLLRLIRKLSERLRAR